MKINWLVRIKNPYFWIGLVALFFATIGIDPSTLTSWTALLDCLKSFICNPFLIGCTIIAVIGYINDHTTKGLKDSDKAMAYRSPKDETEVVADQDEMEVE